MPINNNTKTQKGRLGSLALIWQSVLEKENLYKDSYHCRK